MHTDWNGNGRHDMADDYVDDMLSSGSGPARPAHRGGSGRRLMPTWLLVAAVAGIVSGDLPINTLTVLLAVVMAVIIMYRVIS